LFPLDSGFRRNDIHCPSKPVSPNSSVHFRENSMRCLYTLLGLAAIISAPLFAEPAALPDSTSEPATPTASGGTLSLREALALTLERNPELAAAAHEIAARDGVVLQAGLLPNPALAFTAEDVSLEDYSTSLQLSQLVELGGKRRARVGAAIAGRELAELELAVRRNDLLAAVTKAFVDVLGAQERRTLAQENLDLAERFAATVSRRVDAGKVSPVEATKVSVDAATARIELEQAERELTAARKLLASYWGDADMASTRVVGELAATSDSFPPLEDLRARLRDNPAWQLQDKAIAERQALVDVEQTKRTPDVTVSAGVKRFPDLDENALIFEAAVPLPLFDRNQGNLREAEARLTKSTSEQQAAQVAMISELNQTYESLRAADREVTLLRTEVLPAAESAFAAAGKGYELGKFGFIDVLDAQRTLFQNRALYLRALVNHQRLTTDLERLIAGPVTAADTQQ
jgi:cobalt-zinc-cadmium efflux system outer membrane protein